MDWISLSVSPSPENIVSGNRAPMIPIANPPIKPRSTRRPFNGCMSRRSQRRAGMKSKHTSQTTDQGHLLKIGSRSYLRVNHSVLLPGVVVMGV